MLEALIKRTPPFKQLRALRGAFRAYFSACYYADGMRLHGKSMEWAKDPNFARAYAAGMATGHRFGDIRIDWRAHVACWAASHAMQLPGDFVECGVNTGIFSVTVCTFLDFNTVDKDFWLYDTFQGIPPEQMKSGEFEPRTKENADYYFDSYSAAQRNFSPWPRAKLVRGRIPDTLTEGPRKVCYLSIDMNIVEPEIAAIEHFWPLLSPGAPIILDDYGWEHYSLQREGMDRFAQSKGVRVLTLPTGQGLILKP